MSVVLFCVLAAFLHCSFLILLVFVFNFCFALRRCRHGDLVAFQLHLWFFVPPHRIVPLACFFLLFFVGAVWKIITCVLPLLLLLTEIISY